MSKQKPVELDEKQIVDEMVEAAFEEPEPVIAEPVVEGPVLEPEPMDCPDGKCETKRALSSPKIFLKDLKVGQRVNIDSPLVNGSSPFICTNSLAIQSTEGFVTIVTTSRAYLAGELLD